MELKAFRELLSKNSSDAILDYAIQKVSDEMLSDLVIESLEKMAKMQAKGPALHLAEEHSAEHSVDPEISTLPDTMLHAIGHHIANYKSAMADGNANKANYHAKMYGRYMKLGEGIKNSLSDGSFDFKSVSPRPWQYQLRHGEHDQNRGQISFNGQKPKDVPGWKSDHKGYDWLQLNPHAEHSDHKDVTAAGHLGQYPMEAVSINGKQVVVPDAQSTKHAVPHPFDNHPAVLHVNKSNAELSKLDLDKEMGDYHTLHGDNVAGLAPHQPAQKEVSQPVIPSEKPETLA